MKPDDEISLRTQLAGLVHQINAATIKCHEADMAAELAGYANPGFYANVQLASDLEVEIFVAKAKARVLLCEITGLAIEHIREIMR